jgi:serine/threonine protein kinase/Flp pilus assembly protein TadD
VCGAVLAPDADSCPHCSPTLPPRASDPSQAPTLEPDKNDLATVTAGPTPGGRAVYSGPKKIGGYRILRELGAGGMGTVFEAFEEKMNRKVALKVLARHISESEKASDRFAREAWIAGRLSHPNLVRVFERGEEQDVSFFSMEFVDGGSLNDVIRNLRTWGKDERYGLHYGTREYVSWAIGQVIQAARGLESAHRQGVIHRDIKPMNILIQKDPFAVKVADFGLAVDLGATRMTTVGKVMGTIAYMAPEQIQGKQELVGPRTDVYALGVTLFEMLTLELPFVGATQQIYMNAVLTAEARRPRKLNERVGRDLEVVLQKALEKDPGDRYASAGALADDLENVLQFRPIGARPPGTLTRFTKWARRRPMHAALAALLVVGVPATSVLAIRAVQHRRLVTRLNVDQWRAQSERLIHDERFRDALIPLDRILSARPEDLDAVRNRALCVARLAMVEKDPGRKKELETTSLDGIGNVIRRLPDTRWPYRVRAFLLKSFGREKEAAVDERKAASLRSTAPDFYEVQIDGILAFHSQDYAKAVEAFDELIRRRPDSADERIWRASAYEELGQPQRAMTDYEVAAALKPKDVVSRVNLARLKIQSGSLDEADQLLRRSLQIDPDSAQLHESLSANLLEQGRKKISDGDAEAAGRLFTQAEAEARQAVKADPQLAWAHVNLGASLMEQNRLGKDSDRRRVDEAVSHYDQALRLREAARPGPRDPIYLSALVNQCDALIQEENLEKALETCRHVTELQPGNPVAFYNLAGVYALSGKSDDALRCLEKDIALGDRDWSYLASDHWFASLRRDPRFTALLERMKKSAPGS